MRNGGRVAAALAVLGMTACAGGETPREAVPLSGTFESAEALGRAVLAGFGAGDRAALAALALSEAEFRDQVWPEMPASRPERNVPFEYAWGQLRQRSDASLTDLFARHAGRRLTLIRTGFTGETTPYQTFVVMRDSEIVARDESGREWVLRLYGSALVRDGRYKLFSFVVDQ